MRHEIILLKLRIPEARHEITFSLKLDQVFFQEQLLSAYTELNSASKMFQLHQYNIIESLKILSELVKFLRSREAHEDGKYTGESKVSTVEIDVVTEISSCNEWK